MMDGTITSFRRLPSDATVLQKRVVDGLSDPLIGGRHGHELA
jgi:hypothetical protein